MESLVRHLISTLAFRVSYAIKDCPQDYPTFCVGNEVKTPVQLLNHMSEVLGYALRSYGDDFIPDGTIPVVGWEAEVSRFYTALERLDRKVEREGLSSFPLSAQQIVQGPLSDVLTHIGQLCTLRRIFGAPVQEEDFIVADIQVGKIV